MALLRVLFPEPFGPITACTSPLGISSVKPRMISFSPMRTCRFSIFNEFMSVKKFFGDLFPTVLRWVLGVRRRALRASLRALRARDGAFRTQSAEGNLVLQNRHTL